MTFESNHHIMINPCSHKVEPCAAAIKPCLADVTLQNTFFSIKYCRFAMLWFHQAKQTKSLWHRNLIGNYKHKRYKILSTTHFLSWNYMLKVDISWHKIVFNVGIGLLNNKMYNKKISVWVCCFRQVFFLFQMALSILRSLCKMNLKV